MSVVISGEIDLERAGDRERALIDGQPFIAQALAESGCVHYDWTADPVLPARIHVFEEWVSEADLIAHLAGQPYRSMAGHLQGMGIAKADTRKYRVDLIEPVYDPDGQPRGDFFTAKPGS